MRAAIHKAWGQESWDAMNSNINEIDFSGPASLITSTFAAKRIASGILTLTLSLTLVIPIAASLLEEFRLTDAQIFGWVGSSLFSYSWLTSILGLRQWRCAFFCVLFWGGVLFCVAVASNIPSAVYALTTGRLEFAGFIAAIPFFLAIFVLFLANLSLALGLTSVAFAKEVTRERLNFDYRSPLNPAGFWQLLEVPSLQSFGSVNKITIALQFVLCSILVGLSTTALVIGPALTIAIMQDPGDINIAQFYIMVAAMSATLLFSFLANVVRRSARSRAVSSLTELLASDNRPPILFLRAFRDDQVTLPTPRYDPLGKLLNSGFPKEHFEHLLLLEGTRFGPVVALGNPNDRYPPYGVSRGYFEHKDWKGAVSDLAQKSAAIVLCFDETDSVLWELEHIIQHQYVHKALFLIHPQIVGKPRKDLVRALWGQLNVETDGSELNRDGGEKEIIGVWNGGPDYTTRLAVSANKSRDSYFALLRWFLLERFQIKVPD